jgi:hypothetical protein
VSSAVKVFIFIRILELGQDWGPPASDRPPALTFKASQRAGFVLSDHRSGRAPAAYEP